MPGVATVSFTGLFDDETCKNIKIWCLYLYKIRLCKDVASKKNMKITARRVRCDEISAICEAMHAYLFKLMSLSLQCLGLLQM